MAYVVDGGVSLKEDNISGGSEKGKEKQRLISGDYKRNAGRVYARWERGSHSQLEGPNTSVFTESVNKTVSVPILVNT